MGNKFKIESKLKKERWLLSTKNTIESNLNEEFHIELAGKQEFTLEGCRGVYEYRNDYIKLRLKNGFTVITGHNFDIINFEGNTITVKGKVLSIEFSE